MDLANPDVRPPESAAWFRAAGAPPDQPALHRALLAYASDSGRMFTEEGVLVASTMQEGLIRQRAERR